jgi:uncharacterized protein YejL (UPF0352 family)
MRYQIFSFVSIASVLDNFALVHSWPKLGKRSSKPTPDPSSLIDIVNERFGSVSATVEGIGNGVKEVGHQIESVGSDIGNVGHRMDDIEDGLTHISQDVSNMNMKLDNVDIELAREARVLHEEILDQSEELTERIDSRLDVISKEFEFKVDTRSAQVDRRFKDMISNLGSKYDDIVKHVDDIWKVLSVLDKQVSSGNVLLRSLGNSVSVPERIYTSTEVEQRKPKIAKDEAVDPVQQMKSNFMRSLVATDLTQVLKKKQSGGSRNDERPRTSKSDENVSKDPIDSIKSNFMKSLLATDLTKVLKKNQPNGSLPNIEQEPSKNRT